jgi:hypothetical protein
VSVRVEPPMSWSRGPKVGTVSATATTANIIAERVSTRW